MTFGDLDLAGNVKLRDLFEREDAGTYTDTYSVTVPAHGTRIYMAVADTRLERKRYEAETAYISAYQELKNNQTEKTGIYESADFCSGGYKAGWLGYSEQNDLQWRNVYSYDGGEYTLTIAYISGESRNITITVNGEKASTISGNSGGWSTVATKTVKVNLQKGTNTIRLSNASYWMPDIDYIELTPAQAASINTISADSTGSGQAYNLAGQKVNPNTETGVVIVNGQKKLISRK